MNQGRKVTLSGNFEHTGFLYLCMKEAEHLALTGHACFISEYVIEISVYGSLKNIEIFFNWSIYSLKPLEVQILKVEKIPFIECESFELNNNSFLH